MNLGVKPQTQEEVVECFFVSDVTTQKWKGLAQDHIIPQWKALRHGKYDP